MDAKRTFLLFLGALVLPLSFSSPLRVIIDTDIGRDMDDSWALAFMLGRPDLFDILLILTATFDTRGKAQIVAKNLEDVGRTDIHIGIGKSTDYHPSGKLPGCRVGPMYPWASSYNLSSYPGKLYDDGVAQMATLIKSIPDVLILELAPLTNLLSLRTRFPNLDTHRVSVFAMGGSIRKGYLDRPFLEPEYNIFTDVEAAKLMYNSSKQKALGSFSWSQFVDAPLDTAGIIQLYDIEYELLRYAEQSGNRVLRTLFEAYRVWCKCPTNFVVSLDECNLSSIGCFQNHSIAVRPFNSENTSTALFDVQPVMMAAALVPGSGLPSLTEMLVMENVTLAVDDWCLTVPSYSSFGIGYAGGTLVSAAMAWLPPTSTMDGGLALFKNALVTSLVSHDTYLPRRFEVLHDDSRFVV